MPTIDHPRRDDGYDESLELIHALSLLAALEEATDLEGHAAALPYLGMARAELTDFGQMRVERYVPMAVSDLHGGLRELEDRLKTLLAKTGVPQHRLRIEAALRLLGRSDPACERRYRR
ncbi:hypothetical protein [Ornithinicoccus hortensis]|uniref:Uncharacterized protein n=1 Tax=Ornithinicoccus hortensis TaxID=82346 RepID=A0A542YR66_9MICO|nr:hypothetical protein [Ornithinicoccus hortensis]TQL50580.1 hypothetical protein FB467_1693 [Ornithinicoccus hortensis]